MPTNPGPVANRILVRQVYQISVLASVYWMILPRTLHWLVGLNRKEKIIANDIHPDEKPVILDKFKLLSLNTLTRKFSFILTPFRRGAFHAHAPTETA